ncbi:uncharacterized protein LOC130767363 isoform X2 [Actinidia eriantha]|uniref:uncharacterized protein LOC130767363 isoform X2 n=1 Tax=Actinidia eriantha TaxID=165200 RepID=UPI0025888FEB|nr:uncharacterized protein LOC130767363 isoform X2 [Actinidia eriantha]
MRSRESKKQRGFLLGYSGSQVPNVLRKQLLVYIATFTNVLAALPISWRQRSISHLMTLTKNELPSMSDIQLLKFEDEVEIDAIGPHHIEDCRHDFLGN